MTLAKRLFASLAALMMVCSLSLLTGCIRGGEEAPEESGDSTIRFWENDTPIELTWFYACNDAELYEDVYKRLEDHPFMKRLTEATNVHVTVVKPTESDPVSIRSEFWRMVAADDMTDMVTPYGFSFDDGSSLDDLIEEEVFQRLNEYVEVQMENFNRLREWYGIIDKMMLTPQGNIVYIPMLSGLVTDRNPSKSSGLVIRKDYLDAVGLDVPVTVDDWDAVLTAFKEKLGLETPLAVGSLYTTPFMDGDVFVSCYGQASAFYTAQEDGKRVVRYGGIEEGARRYAAMMRDWNDRGLIEMQNTSDLFADPGKVGAWVGSVADIMWAADNTYDESFELVACPDPVLNEGDRITTRGDDAALIGTPQRYSTYVSYYCENPALAVSWMDAMFSDTKYMEASYGIEGEDYVKNEDGTISFTDKITKDPGGVAAGIVKNCFLQSPYRDPDVLVKYGYTDEAHTACEVWSRATSEDLLPDMDFLSLAPEVIAAMKEANTQPIQTVYMMGFINGTIDLDRWDNYVAAMNDCGIDKVLPAYQAAYDRLAGQETEAA